MSIQPKSFYSMVKDGDIKRADAMKACIDDLHEEPGFNRRYEGAELDDSIEQLAAFISAGGMIPDVEVRVREEGGLWLVDGHRRTRAMKLLAGVGDALDQYRDKKSGKVYMSVKQFTGDELQRKARISTSRDGRDLSPLERAETYNDLRNLGASNEEIAELVKKSKAHVDQMLLLLTAPSEVHQAVRDGSISATEAVKLTRDHGANAGQELEARKESAKAQGKNKVTAAVAPKVRGKDYPTNLVAAARAFLNSFSEADISLTVLGSDPDFQPEIDLSFLAELMMAIGELPADESADTVDDGQMDMLRGAV